MGTMKAIRRTPSTRRRTSLTANVGRAERVASLAGGGVMVAGGLRQRGVLGGALAATGAWMLFRGATGHCPLYQRLRLSTAHAGEAGLYGSGEFAIHTKLIVDRPREMVYRRWRELENLPHFMRHIKDIETEGNLSHWTARGPLGTTLRWDSQIIQDTPDERIVWRSIPGSDVDTEGEVRFRPAADGDGTELEVYMRYRPPGGALLKLLAPLVGGLSARRVKHDLERFKQGMESQASLPQSPRREVLDQGLGRPTVTPAHG